LKKIKRNPIHGLISIVAGLLLIISCTPSPQRESVYQVYKTKKGYDKMMSLYGEYLSKWIIPYKEIDVETTWGKTHIIRSGLNNKKPLIILHGGGSNSALMCSPELARDHALYSIDIMGEPGKSVPRRIPTTPAEVAGWLNEVFTALKIGKADIFGISYGGFTGQWFLNFYPERVNRLVMVSYSYMDQSLPLLSIIKLTYYMIRNNDAGIQSMMELLNGGPVKNREFVEIFADFLRNVNKHCRQQRANPYESVPAAEVKKVKSPVLIIMGDRDCLFDTKKAADFCTQANNPNITFKTIPGMGHLPTDHLAEMYGLTLEFLK
jgi:pimeloyl-ACP methyl ester carboxylesterase